MFVDLATPLVNHTDNPKREKKKKKKKFETTSLNKVIKNTTIINPIQPMSLINAKWNKISTELIQDPNNLDLWKELILSSETIDKKPITKSSSSEQIKLLKTSYESFLNKYPFEFKYWMKYANWEFKLGNTNQANEIYLKSLDISPWCIELWIDFLKFKIETISNNIDSILKLFEKSRSFIGFHFYSSEFYELYLEFLDNYKNDNNEFEKKYFILLRIILEIPLYNYGFFYKKWFDLIDKLSKDEKLAKDKLQYILPNDNYKIDKKLFAELKKRFTDAYISTQFHTFELYNFEKKLITKRKTMSIQDIEAWLGYIEYLEIKQYPNKFIELVYYRWIYKETTNEVIWLKLADFYIYHNKFNQARKSLNDALRYVNNDYKVLIKLVDLEIYLKNYQRAINLLIGYLQFNTNIPLVIQEKVMQVKKLIEK